MDDIRRMEEETKRQLDEVSECPQETLGSRLDKHVKGTVVLEQLTEGTVCGSRNVSVSAVGKA